MYMVMFILDDLRRLDDVLEAWGQIGISGATILESTGFYRRRAVRMGVHARFNIEGRRPGEEAGNYTILAIVPDEEVARQCLAAAERVVGDLDGPDTGVLAAWPLAVVKGVPPFVRARAVG